NPFQLPWRQWAPAAASMLRLAAPPSGHAFFFRLQLLLLLLLLAVWASFPRPSGSVYEQLLRGQPRPDGLSGQWRPLPGLDARLRAAALPPPRPGHVRLRLRRLHAPRLPGRRAEPHPVPRPGPDRANPDNININDVLGDYSLGLVDSLTTLAVVGNVSEFRRAVSLLADRLSFDTNSTVQTFEAGIRVLGGLLSAHLLATDSRLPSSASQATAISFCCSPATSPTACWSPSTARPPASRIPGCTCSAESPRAAGWTRTWPAPAPCCWSSPPSAGWSATPPSRARPGAPSLALWDLRSRVTGLLGSSLNLTDGRWLHEGLSGLGAGSDSFYEILLKSAVYLDDPQLGALFSQSMDSVAWHQRAGRTDCLNGLGQHPIWLNTEVRTGHLANSWCDALQLGRFLLLAGRLDEAICLHAYFANLMHRYKLLPERFNWRHRQPEVLFSPLRPELAETNYFLYRATGNHFFLHVGAAMVDNLNKYAKSTCGYATLHNVHNLTDLEDRQESFFLAETVKYLYLLFDETNWANRMETDLIFTTEGHPLSIARFRSLARPAGFDFNVTPPAAGWSGGACHNFNLDRRLRHLLPLSTAQWVELDRATGLSD
uniref:alpha-1,2-Mannosidase n=1 Tax=Macrostomum lignano TaxID=282301 RepID=A0A1I8HHF2_9PLAT